MTMNPKDICQFIVHKEPAQKYDNIPLKGALLRNCYPLGRMNKKYVWVKTQDLVFQIGVVTRLSEKQNLYGKFIV